MAIIDDALATGGDPNISNAFTINGQPGDLYNCSNGMLYKEFLFLFFFFLIE
jgi:laccase